MGLPSSSNSTSLLRAIIRSRFAPAAEFDHTSVTILELTDSVVAVLFWLCELSLVITLVGLTLVAVTVPNSMSYLHRTTPRSTDEIADSVSQLIEPSVGERGDEPGQQRDAKVHCAIGTGQHC